MQTHGTSRNMLPFCGHWAKQNNNQALRHSRMNVPPRFANCAAAISAARIA
jgi:hypothetical protein